MALDIGRIVKNPYLSDEELTHLALSEDWHVREPVAKHPNIPDTLARLAKDGNVCVRSGGAENPHTLTNLGLPVGVPMPNAYNMSRTNTMEIN